VSGNLPEACAERAIELPAQDTWRCVAYFSIPTLKCHIQTHSGEIFLHCYYLQGKSFCD
jgi:hypothetical protein